MQRIIQSGLITEVTGVCVCAVLLLSPLSVIDLPNSDQYSQIFQLQSISCPPITFSSGHPHSTSGQFFSSSVILIPSIKFPTLLSLCYFLLTPAPDACLRALALRSPQLTLPHSSAPSSS